MELRQMAQKIYMMLIILGGCPSCSWMEVEYLIWYPMCEIILIFSKFR